MKFDVEYFENLGKKLRDIGGIIFSITGYLLLLSTRGYKLLKRTFLKG